MKPASNGKPVKKETPVKVEPRAAAGTPAAAKVKQDVKPAKLETKSAAKPPSKPAAAKKDTGAAAKKDTGAAAPRRNDGQSHFLQSHGRLEDLVKPHVQSFNFMLEQGLTLAVAGLQPSVMDADEKAGFPGARCTYAAHCRCELITWPCCAVWVEDVSISAPSKERAGSSTDDRVFPSEARELAASYSGPLNAVCCRQVRVTRAVPACPGSCACGVCACCVGRLAAVRWSGSAGSSALFPSWFG